MMTTMMKKTIFSLMAVLALTACKNDDTDFSAYTNGSGGTTTETINTIYIAYSGTSVTVTGDDNGYVTTDGADVTVNTGTDTDSLLLVLSGTTTDGSLLVYRSKKYGIQLNSVNITNADGPAINNQCGKSLYLQVVSGTTNTLTDGTTYTEQSYDQKGALFSEGQIYFSGTGTLTVTGNCKHAIACDDYIVLDEATISATTSTGHGIKVNDGIWSNGGTLDISTTATGGRGIKCDSVVVVSGGTTTISTTGGCLFEDADGNVIDDPDLTTPADTTSAACIKCDYDFQMTGGTLTMTSSGDGGKGLNCAASVTVSGGTFSAITTGGNEYAKPKAVKGDSGITLSGGSFFAKVNKSWACDNGSDSDTASERVTISGTPSATATKTVDDVTYTSPTYAKKAVFVAF